MHAGWIAERVVLGAVRRVFLARFAAEPMIATLGAGKHRKPAVMSEQIKHAKRPARRRRRHDDNDGP